MNVSSGPLRNDYNLRVEESGVWLINREKAELMPTKSNSIQNHTILSLINFLSPPSSPF